MKTLTILQQIITPPLHITTKPNQRPQINPPLRRQTWRLQSSAKGFTGNPNKNTAKTNNGKKQIINNGDDGDDDDKIPDSVWKRMITRIMFYVGVPLATGFALLQVFGVAEEKGVWDVPKWVPFLTTFITFGSSALGIAIGSLTTSLDEEEEGSFLGFEQVEKNWVEMWKEDE